MRILFVHQNYPAQFRHVAAALAGRGHDVRAVTRAGNPRPDTVPTRRYEAPTPDLGETPDAARTFAGQVVRGEAAAAAVGSLVAEGWVPDVIVGHPGWGETLFLRDVCPGARIVAFAEFYYASDGADIGFDPEFPTVDDASRRRVRARNAAMSLAMLDADLAVSPTHWQASRFPAELRPKIRVVHEGIDTGEVAPCAETRLTLGRDGLSLRPGDEVVTFVNRNLEPYRGYHVLMRALPAILAARPRARVVIVGGDGVSYGGPPPAGRSWKTVFLAEVGSRLPMERVHFVGRVPRRLFVELMQVSAAHVYLTYPFVLSWSLLEAMSAGALVVGSRTPPVEEVIAHGENGLLVDFFDVEGLAATVVDALARPDAHADLRVRARRTILERYDLATQCLPAWIRLIEEAA